MSSKNKTKKHRKELKNIKSKNYEWNKKKNYIDNNSYNNNTQYFHHSGTVSFLQRVRVHLIRLSEQTEVHKRVSCSQEDFPV